jgi:hypothetical protein
VGRLASLLSRIATCTVCGGPMGASKRGVAPIYVCQGPEDENASRGHCQFPLDFADRVVVSRLIQQMEDTGRTPFRPLPVPVDLTPLKVREAEIAALMAELVEDRTAGLIDRAALVVGTATLREELTGIRQRLTEAEGHTPAKMIDMHDEFNQLDLGERRATLREAFAFIRVVPRGKGRPKAGQPIWRAALIETEFTPAWS